MASSTSTGPCWCIQRRPAPKQPGRAEVGSVGKQPGPGPLLVPPAPPRPKAAVAVDGVAPEVKVGGDPAPPRRRVERLGRAGGEPALPGQLGLERQAVLARDVE